jgi:hypothetical protein
MAAAVAAITVGSAPISNTLPTIAIPKADRAIATDRDFWHGVKRPSQKKKRKRGRR